MKKRIDRRYIFLLFFIFIFASIVSFINTQNSIRTQAKDLPDFRPGNIISDNEMSDYNSMNKMEIQKFLRSKNSCNNTNVHIAKEVQQKYPHISYHIKDGKFVCLAEEDFNGESAADIIYEASQRYKINPQVLIVLLEKEQGLVTDTYPHNYQLRSATGYGCPDNDVCDSKYYGFKNQINHAAKLFRKVLDGGWTNFPLGYNYIQYHPNKSCGGSNVYIENLATSALYRYTPYQPNKESLESGYQSSSSCAAYGNRNFFRLFYAWFGKKTETGDTADLSKALESIIKNLSSHSGSNSTTQTQSSSNTQNHSTINPNTHSAPSSPNHTSQSSNSQLIKNGIYHITTSLDPKQYLDVSRANKSEGAKIQLYEQWSKNNKAQEWEITHLGNNLYTIKSSLSNKYLSFLNDIAKNTTHIILLSKNTSSCSQKWHASRKGDSIIFLSSCNTKYALDVDRAIAKNTAKVQLYEQWSKNNKAQEWELSKK